MYIVIFLVLYNYCYVDEDKQSFHNRVSKNSLIRYGRGLLLGNAMVRSIAVHEYTVLIYLVISKNVACATDCASTNRTIKQ